MSDKIGEEIPLLEEKKRIKEEKADRTGCVWQIDGASSRELIKPVLSLTASIMHLTWTRLGLWAWQSQLIQTEMTRGSMAFTTSKQNTWAPLAVDWCGQLSLTKENPAPSSLSSPAPASSILDRLHWKAISWRLCGATYPQLDLTRLSWSFSLPWFEFHWLSQSTSSQPDFKQTQQGCYVDRPGTQASR